MSAGTVGIMLFCKWRKSGVLDVTQAQGTAAGRGVGGARRPLRAGHEREDKPAVLRVAEGVAEQGGRAVAHRVTTTSAGWP